MICIYLTVIQKTHTHTHTELFKILFSPLTLSTTFLQKASGPEKNTVPYSYSYMIDLELRTNELEDKK